MSAKQNPFDEYIKNNPREGLRLLLIAASLVWFSPVCLLSLILYLVLGKMLKLQWWIVLCAGVLVALLIVGIDAYQASNHFSLPLFVKNGFQVNFAIWKAIAAGQLIDAFKYLGQYGMSYLLGMPLLFAGALCAVDSIEDKRYQKTITALQKGEHTYIRKELSERQLTAALIQIDENNYDGTVLGVSKYSGMSVVLPDYYINQVLLVLGTTGSGKTVTLRRFYKRAITKGLPLIIVGGKPTAENVQWVQALAEKHGRKFYGFNCGNFSHYDPLSDGGYTELKDKVISLKDEWENDYYKSVSEDYLQAVFRSLISLV